MRYLIETSIDVPLKRGYRPMKERIQHKGWSLKGIYTQTQYLHLWATLKMQLLGHKNMQIGLDIQIFVNFIFQCYQ